MKTEPEIQSVFDYLCTNDEEDLCGYGNDLPYIENTRAFKEALLWVMKPNASQSGIEADAESRLRFGKFKVERHPSSLKPLN